jgi:hypothetical protein
MLRDPSWQEVQLPLSNWDKRSQVPVYTDAGEAPQQRH